jgi:hypothetical protein
VIDFYVPGEVQHGLLQAPMDRQQITSHKWSTWALCDAELAEMALHAGQYIVSYQMFKYLELYERTFKVTISPLSRTDDG